MLQELENPTKLDRTLARSLGVPVTEEPTTRSGPRREVTMHRKRAIEEVVHHAKLLQIAP